MPGWDQPWPYDTLTAACSSRVVGWAGSHEEDLGKEGGISALTEIWPCGWNMPRTHLIVEQSFT